MPDAAVKRLRTSSLLRGLVAGVVLFQFVLMLAMASSERLHHKLHHHAGEEDHQCEVTLIHHGGVEEPLPPLTSMPADVACALPDVLVPPPRVTISAAHLRGGVLAQSPPRGP